MRKIWNKKSKMRKIIIFMGLKRVDWEKIQIVNGLKRVKLFFKRKNQILLEKFKQKFEN